MNRFPTTNLLGAVAVAVSLSLLCAGTTNAAPAFSSRPGAAYTIYLDFDGFNYTGSWYTYTPGNTPAYSAANPNHIADIWARTAEKYAAFNVNVTTIDPAIAAGRASSYADRQSYYDQTARVMHTVVGNNSWVAAGGISFLGTAQYSYPGTNSGTSNGYHTNFTFPSQVGSSAKNIGEVNAHENGHALGLNHQNDVSTPATNDYSSNNGASGNGSYAPIMGDSYTAQRGTWSEGTINKSPTQRQNDVAVLLANSGISLIDSGIGHSFATATQLPLTGTLVNSTLAQGVITPLVGQTPNPIGIDNYTKDYFKFTVGTSGAVTLTVNNGGDWLTPGTVSNGFTLRSKLNIFSASDLTNPFAFGIENAATSAVTFAGSLVAGDYYAQITSFGGYTSTFDTGRRYYDMGSYVLSGSGFNAFVVPEPGTIGLLGLGVLGIIIRLRRKK